MEFEVSDGYALINSDRYTKNKFGTNAIMQQMIGNGYKYKYSQRFSRREGCTIYSINDWTWVGEDLTLLDKDGNEIIEEEIEEFPEPIQFDIKELDI